MTWPIVNLAMFILDTTQCLILNLNFFAIKVIFAQKLTGLSNMMMTMALIMMGMIMMGIMMMGMMIMGMMVMEIMVAGV